MADVTPLTDGFIGPRVTLADFRRLTEGLPEDTIIKVEALPLFEAADARKVQVTYAAANADQQTRVVIG